VCGGTRNREIQIKLYYSLLDLFTDNNFKSIYSDVAQYGWFKRGNRFAKSINIDGRRGYMRVSNSGNCKFRNYFFKIKWKKCYHNKRRRIWKKPIRVKFLKKGRKKNNNKIIIIKEILKGFPN